MKMKHEEMLKINSINVFNEILNGVDTVSKISKSLNISHTTVEKACEILTKLKVIKSHSENNNSRGRPLVKYSIADNHYSVYIEESEHRFSCIFIDATSYAIDRFDKRKFISYVSLEEVVGRVSRAITMRDDYKRFCRNVFVYCGDESAQYFPGEFTRIETREEFIAQYLKTDNEIVLFEFPTRCILSVYGKIICTNAKRKGIEHVFTPDRILKIKEPFYEEIFESLKFATLDKIKTIL